MHFFFRSFKSGQQDRRCHFSLVEVVLFEGSLYMEYLEYLEYDILMEDL